MTPCHTSCLLAALWPSIVCSRCLRLFLRCCNVYVYVHVHVHVVYACVDDVLDLDVQDMDHLNSHADERLRTAALYAGRRSESKSPVVVVCLLVRCVCVCVCSFVCLFVCL